MRQFKKKTGTGKKEKAMYKVEREFLNKLTGEELIARVIRNRIRRSEDR